MKQLAQELAQRLERLTLNRVVLVRIPVLKNMPESFLIVRQGVIRFKHVGPLNEEIIRSRLIPLVREFTK